MNRLVIKDSIEAGIFPSEAITRKWELSTLMKLQAHSVPGKSSANRNPYILIPAPPPRAPPPGTDQDYFFTAVLTQVGQDFWIPSIRSFCVSCGTLSNSTTPMTLTGNVFFCLPDHYQWKRCKPRAGQPLAPGGPAQHFSSLPSLEPQAGGNTIHHFFGCKLCKKMHSIFKKRKWNKQKMASSLSSLLPIPLLSYICPLSFTPSQPQYFSHIFPRWVFKCIDSGMRKPVCGSLFHNFIALLSSGWRNLTLCTVTSSFRKWW